MNTKLETIILRFRDLGTANTIGDHQCIIDKTGYVWWGWWAKPQEKVPVNEFNILSDHAGQPKGLEMFLFDSGKLELYRALCNDIYYHNGKLVKAPQPDATPKYYRDNTYMAWFKFANIRKCEREEAEKILKKYSYLRVDDFFTDGQSPFHRFYDKKVYGLNELLQQQRTIWFLKKYEHGDRADEVLSYIHDYTTDELANRVYRVLASNDILWVSDLHFSDKYHAFTEDAGDTNRLSIRLNSEIERFNNSPSYMIVSGDLTYRAVEDEFNSALTFLHDMNSIYKISSKECSIVPGNHDIAFSDKEFDEKNPVTVAFESAKEAYVNFYKEYYRVEPEDKLFSVHRFLTGNLQPIEVIGLNSCLLQQERNHFQGMGFVGNDQMKEVEQYLSATEDSRVLRILVMHHHLLPVLFKEKAEADRMYSMMLDSEAISQFIVRNKIKLVLHGHTHKEFYSEIIRKNKDGEKYKYYVVGLGSTGVSYQELSETRTNMFAVLSIGHKDMIIKGYSLYPDGQESKLLFEHIIPIEEKIIRE